MRRDALTLSITLLSVLPAAGGGSALPGPSRQTAGEAMAWAPVVGLLLGVLAAAVLWVCDHLLHTGSLVAAALSVGSLAVLTRALHLDGLADLADGLGSRQPAAGRARGHAPLGHRPVRGGHAGPDPAAAGRGADPG